MRPILVPCWITYVKGIILLIIIRQCYKHLSAYCSKMDSLEAKIFVTLLQILAGTVGSQGEWSCMTHQPSLTSTQSMLQMVSKLSKPHVSLSESLPASMSSMLSSFSIVSCSSFLGSSSNSGRPSSSLNHWCSIN